MELKADHQAAALCRSLDENPPGESEEASPGSLLASTKRSARR